MEHVWSKIRELRAEYDVLREDRTPIDVFVFFEVDLGLDAIPFDNLTSKYRVEAAITADFTGLYLDAEQYALMEKGPDWKLNRLRFTIAHELAHYYLHRDLPQVENFASLAGFAKWTPNYGGRKYTTEQEADEFAGCLLVPETCLRSLFDKFASQAEELLPNFMQSSQVRDNFADQIAPRFGVNSKVIEIRLQRHGIWSVA
jgi:Zn-dependent peptidase ImmA (M78 family)